jgi:hypothetical protein
LFYFFFLGGAFVGFGALVGFAFFVGAVVAVGGAIVGGGVGGCGGAYKDLIWNINLLDSWWFQVPMLTLVRHKCFQQNRPT